MLSKLLCLMSAAIGIELVLLAHRRGRVRPDPRNESFSSEKDLLNSHDATHTVPQACVDMLPGGKWRPHFDARRTCFPRRKINEILSPYLLQDESGSSHI